VNFAYDAAGRLLSEDYSPCEPHHAPYGAAPEVTYEYDDAALDAGEAFISPTDPHMLGDQNCRIANHTRGRLVAVTDRAQRSLTCYDGRGRTVEVAKRLANPGGVIDGRWYNRRATYDGSDRPVTDSTGATTNQPSTVTTTYTLRGAVDQVLSSYGLLVDHVRRDADGMVTEIQYGDAASTTTAFTYDDLRRLRNLTTYRASLDGWVHGPGTQQMLLQDEQFSYDRVGNPVEIRDWRDPAEWPAGAKPVTRKMQYDSLYRLSRMDYQYSAGDDVWVDPYRAETEDPSRPQPSPRADFAGGKRVQWQSFRYDWLGNTEVTDDDAHAFYDRSLGEVKNVGYKLQGADIDAGDRQGELGTVYDAAGNLVQLDVDRHGDVVGGVHWPPSAHGQERLVQRYAYEWDEVGRLVRARRWDMQNPTTIPPDDADVDAELSFTYDASDQRVRKTSGARHTLYVFASLELRGAEYEAGDYSQTEVPFLFANGVRLARVVHGDSTEVYLELGDHLGSTSVVLDHATGELVQRDTAYAYGAVESSYRPEKFEEFREDYRFTGKEDDVEIGLIYFGKRYYAPLLQRWISADPLAVHAPGEADLNLYAYVRGKALILVDPVGLKDNEVEAKCSPSTSKNRSEARPHRVEPESAPESPGDSDDPALGYARNAALNDLNRAQAEVERRQKEFDVRESHQKQMEQIADGWDRWRQLNPFVDGWHVGNEASCGPACTPRGMADAAKNRTGEARRALNEAKSHRGEAGRRYGQLDNQWQARSDIKRGPGGAKKHNPGKNHRNAASERKQTERFQKKKAQERATAETERATYENQWNNLREDVRKQFKDINDFIKSEKANGR
jgi:RHS repeat-associated protein